MATSSPMLYKLNVFMKDDVSPATIFNSIPVVGQVAVAAEIFTEEVDVQPRSSVTTTIYVPGQRLLKEGVFISGLLFHS